MVLDVAAPTMRTAPLADPPARRLAGDALSLIGWLASSRLPRAWRTPGFGDEVGLIRRHLAFVHGRATLAASFGREAFNIDPAGREERLDRAFSGSPIRIAYAIRWLELGDGIDRPAWRVLIGELAGGTPV